MKRIRWFGILLSAVIALMAFQATRLLRAQPATTPRPADVAAAARTVQSPTRADTRDRDAPTSAVAAGNGVVEPAQPESRLGAPEAGVIAKVLVTEGDRVRAGTPLVELERSAEAAAVEEARALVDAARAELDRVVKGSRAEDVRAARAESDGARARAALAAGVAERTQRAAAAGALTGDELERAQRESEAAEATVRIATAREQAVLAGSRREEVRLARARLAAAEARLAQTSALHARRLVTAPVTGDILQLGYRAGEYYQPGGEPLAILGDLSALRVRLDIDERAVGAVSVGADVLVHVNAFPERELAGSVVDIGRRMGRKNIRTDDPTERNDTKILEVVVALRMPPAAPLLVGQRVTGYLLSPAPKEAP